MVLPVLPPWQDSQYVLLRLKHLKKVGTHLHSFYQSKFGGTLGEYMKVHKNNVGSPFAQITNAFYLFYLKSSLIMAMFNM